MAFEGNRHGANCGRIVHNLKTGAHFVETCNKHWAERYDAYHENHAKPAPMPMGHLMFSEFEHYYTAICGN